MKNMLSSIFAIVAVCVLCVGVSHASVIINFDELEIAGTGNTIMPSYSKSGYTLTSTGSNGFASAQQSHHFYFNSASLTNNTDVALTTLTKSGDPFTISSIDVHALWSYPAPFDFYAYSGSSQVGHLSYSITDYEWNTVNFDSGFENITSLKWVQAYPYHSFDNLVLSGSSAVPEPATMALFGIGSAAFAFARKRKRA